MPRGVRRAAARRILSGVVVLIAAGAAAAQPAAVSAKVNAAEVVRVIRAAAAGGTPALAPDLDMPLAGPLIVSLYHDAAPLQRVSAKPALGQAALEAGRELHAFLARMPNAQAVLNESRIAFDLVASRTPLAGGDRFGLVRNMQPGLDGLAVTTAERTVYFTPLTVLRHWHYGDLLKGLYQAQESARPPAQCTLERFTTLSFAEDKPQGRVGPFYRGNARLPAPDAERLVESVSRAGLWFLRTQQPDGAFILRYDPSSDAPPSESYNLSDHLRATIGLALLRSLTGDEKFDKALDAAVLYVASPKFVRTEPNVAYLPQENDEVTGTALLLAALSARALARPEPEAGGLMRPLANFLLTMTTPDGHIYVRLANARRNAPPFLARGGVYAETLLALTSLQRLSPTEPVRAACAALADLLANPPRDVAVHGDPRALARAIEALAEHDKLTRTDRHAAAIAALAVELMTRQVPLDKAACPDYAGGFGEVDLPPDAFTTAAAAAALSAMYEMSLLARRPESPYAAPVRNAALFLVNLQFRPENTFFLARRELLLGALRRDPGDLTVHAATVAESLRALIAATPVTAETMAPAPAVTKEKHEKSAPKR